MAARPRGLAIVFLTLASVLLLAWLAFWRRGEPRSVSPRASDAEPAERRPLAEQHDARAAGVPPASDAPAESDPSGTTDGLVPAEDMDAMAAAWSAVDLDEVRRALPHNLYFELSSPTQNEAVLAERAAERDRWNVQYGKMLSGTGSEEEIREYYDFRARLSTDYVEFATYLLDHYGEQIPERDIGLLQLARRLHLARVEEIPRKVEEALQRKRLQDEARAAWLADEAELGHAAPPAEPK